MASPDVSVVIGAYNALPYLYETLDSVLKQSIGMDRLELVVVDDGSTDGTGDVLDEYAAKHPNMTVLHQPNSGGPAAPRNAGMDVAKGKYVYFLDADDYIGLEAMERLVAMAEENGSDIVLGKMVGVNGRGVAASMFRHDEARADLYNSRIYYTLSALKLFRRQFLVDLGVRFPTDLPTGEDQPFTARAYVAAKNISVLSSYECYYATLRDDGGNTTGKPGVSRRLPFYRAMFDDFLPTVEAGRKRDALARRHLSVEQAHFLSHMSRETDEEVKKAAFDEFRAWVKTYLNDDVLKPMSAWDKVRLPLIAGGFMDEAIASRKMETSKTPYPIVVENGRVYAKWPTFRDPKYGIPDEAYELRDLPLRYELTAAEWTGSGYRVAGLARVEGVRADRARLVLRRRSDEEERRLPIDLSDVYLTANPNPLGDAEGREARSWDTTLAPGALAKLPGGLWDVFLEVEVGGKIARARVGSKRRPEVDVADRPAVLTGPGAATVAIAYYTSPHSNLTIDIRKGAKEAAGLGLVWRADSGVAVAGATTGATTASAGGTELPVAVVGGVFTASSATVPDGEWDVSVTRAGKTVRVPRTKELPRPFAAAEVPVLVATDGGQGFTTPPTSTLKKLVRKSPLLRKVARKLRGR
ncbi:hypothetical protein Afil01_66960 [Actinorhabdospora filicis]|uniref:Glycosyltransferase involved in cell wall biosynthesis n=1 Tax=Actinorhabdospora filicis TaxID=1785913 RepID=A0A9W6WCR3_9ACTN|nr:glycosyltransferase family 2 protein [Actinorhabdospora filicis]GLZ81889.1 hypothetical protein Afil01_66960 [Actinorhabdospora filicis]